MSPVREEDVTALLATWLEGRGWSVVATHHPGTQGGYRLRMEGAGHSTYIVPDLIAVRGASVLVVESKPAFYLPDLRKIIAVAADPRCHQQLSALLPIPDCADCEILVGIAFAGPFPADITSDVLVFQAEGRTVRLVSGPLERV